MGGLATKFITLIKAAPDLCVDLNEVVKLLKVQKRRVYDITNVLEGIGLVKKCEKNKIQWTGSITVPEDLEVRRDLIDTKRELKEQQEESQLLSNMVQQQKEDIKKISETAQYQEYGFVTYDDLAKLSATEEYKDKKLLIISASTGTEMEVPEKDSVENYFKELKARDPKRVAVEGMDNVKYMVYFKSPKEEIKVFTIENEVEQLEIHPKDDKNQPQEKDEPEKDEPSGEGLCKMFGV